MSKLRKTKNKKLILVLPIILVVSFVVLLTYSFANFKSIKLFDAVGGFFLGNEYTLSYDVANCTNKTIKNGKTFGELCVPAIPDGYTFDGWYYNNELIDSTTQVHTNQNIQLLAQYSAVGRCYIGKTYDFDYTGDVQDFTVQCPGQYQLEVWGAQGGSSRHVDATGLGGYTKGSVFLTANQKLYLYVGQKGEDGGTVNKSPQASFNGGGAGGNSNSSVSNGTYYVSGSGGGATDIRFFGSSSPSSSNLTWNSNLGLNSRVMVAGGGGGSGYLYINDSTWSGAPSGGLIGYDSGEAGGASHLAGATGATQSTGGITSQNLTYGSYSWTKGNNGTFGVGANSVVNGHPGGGGGGGYYGGASGGSGGGSCGGAGGSGGSSYISGHEGSIAIKQGSTSNPRAINTGCSASSNTFECSVHYNNLYFTDTLMIDGNGCKWSTVKTNECSGQPQPDGTVTTGHEGNGYAKISYLGEGLTVNFDAGNLVYDVPQNASGDANTSGSDGKSTFVINDGVVTVTANRLDGYVMTPIKAYLYKDKTYIVNIESDCPTVEHNTNDTVEAYLFRNGVNTNEDYTRIDAFTNYEFTVQNDGVYYFRLDVNKNGYTHTFQNFKISEKITSKHLMGGSQIGTLPTLTNNSLVFGGWYLDDTYTTPVTSSYIVNSNKTIYAKFGNS